MNDYCYKAIFGFGWGFAIFATGGAFSVALRTLGV